MKSPKPIGVAPEPGDPKEGGFGSKALARVALRPTLHGALTMQQIGKSALGELDLSELVEALAGQAKRVSDGDLARPEAMLTTQATALDALFNCLTRRAMSAEYLHHFDAYLRLALKAQAQARATVEALAELKNPRSVLIAQQANVTTGPQQVNNGAPANASRAGKIENEPSELFVTDRRNGSSS